MNDERMGIVRLDYEGRTVPLRFTWRAIDTLGRVGIGELLDKAGSGQPGDMMATAQLLEAASGGEISVDEAMNSAMPFAPVYVALLKAWSLAARQPQGATPGNPLNRLWTSSKRLWGRLTGRG